MTWSLIARDSSGAFGIAVATKNFAVGCRVPFIQAGVGAIATQALVNPFYGAHGLVYLQDQMPPVDIVQFLTDGDEGRDQRQVHMIDAYGRIAAYTGKSCIDWCGHTAGENFSVAGNMLAGEAVIAETAKAYVANAALPFPRRLIAALQAGEAAGGDKRGKQSAALLIYGEEIWPDLDLRVDDHADPLAELERLEKVSRERWVHFAKFLPNAKNPHGELDRAKIDAGIAAGLAAGEQMTALLAIQNLRVVFHGDRGRRTVAVDGVDLTLARGQTLGIVGESGSGKSVTALAVMGLLPKDSAEVSGAVTFDGISLLDLADRPLRDLRGDRLAMIFQEPMTSLNPSYTIGEQIAEVLVRHRGLSDAQARERAIALLRRAGIPSPAERIDDYPHKLSGGMRQRVMIAIALACDPELLIADEPTTALDVTIQAQILDLMRELKRTSDAAIVLITHDLGVVAEVCDEVAVMYAGEIVERAPADALFEAPGHPYTVGLMASIPRLDVRTERLAAIDGVLPDMTSPPVGCRFAARCPFVIAQCIAAPPPVIELGGGRWSRCVRAPLERPVA